MKYKIDFLNQAKFDLVEIEEYISINDYPARAENIITKILETCYSLGKFPFRGHCPIELIGQNFKILEIDYKVYRIFYEVENDVVIIEAILDSRRNIRDLLLGRVQN